jgi:hypothetical protein
MSVTFCSECGKKHEYSFAKPNFCSGCGASFGPAKLASASKKTIPEKSVHRRSQEEFEDIDDEDYSYLDELPDIDKIQVDVQQFDENSTFSLGSIFGQPQEPSSRRRRESLSLETFKNNKK